MRIVLELPDWVGEAIARGPNPQADSGPTIEGRILSICESWARTVQGWEEDDKRKALYRAFGVRPDDAHDDIF